MVYITTPRITLQLLTSPVDSLKLAYPTLLKLVSQAETRLPDSYCLLLTTAAFYSLLLPTPT